MTTCQCVCHLPEVIAEDLRRQLIEEDAGVVRRLRQTSYDVSAAADWSKLAAQPSHAELVERRNRWGYPDPQLEVWRQQVARRFEERRQQRQRGEAS